MPKFEVRTATRKQTKAKIALAGPPGSGKTYTMLRVAMAMASDPSKILINDTEHRSSEKYAEVFKGWQIHTPTRFDPTEMTEIIKFATDEGYEVLGIDSMTHYWAGSGGALEKVGGTATNWKHVTPQWERMVDAIIAAPIHIISCMRAKMAYTFNTNDKGKAEPTRIGIQPVIREDTEYVFDIFGLLDANNTLNVVKSRALEHIPNGSSWPQPGEEFAQRLRLFCAEGVEDRFVLPVNVRDKFNAVRDVIGEAEFNAVLLASGWPSVLAIPSVEEAKRIYGLMQARVKEIQQAA